MSLHRVDTGLRPRPPALLADWAIAVSDGGVPSNFSEADAALLGVGLIAYLRDHHRHVTLLESRGKVPCSIFMILFR